MARMRITAQDFDGNPAWLLSAPGGASALVAARGATLLSWSPDGEVFSGYRNGAELEEAAGGRGLIEAPWVGPLAGGCYTWDGQSYRLEADTTGRCLRVHSCEFRRERSADALILRAELPAVAGYPWPVGIQVVYALGDSSAGTHHLSVSLEVTNLGESCAPVAVAWNGYLRFPQLASISKMSTTVSARTKIAADAHGIPAPGDAALTGVSTPVEWPVLGASRIDSTFTSLVPTSDGVVATVLTDPARERDIILAQEPSEAPYVRLWTGDTLERGAREALLVAPASALPNAFNRSDQVGRVALAPGQSRSLTVTMSYPATSASYARK